MKILSVVLALLFNFSLFAKTNQIPVKKIVLSESNTLVLNDEFNGLTIGKLMNEAGKKDAALKKGEKLYLFLYTPGGDVQTGLNLYDYAAGLNRPIDTITSFAASMGFQTVQQLGTRYITKQGTLMSHQCSGAVEGSFGDKDSQLDHRYQLWLNVIDDLDTKTVRRTHGKQTMKSYRQAYKNEMWLRSTEAINKGYADAIAVVSCDKTMQGTYTKDVKIMMFEVSVIFDKCPMNQYPLGFTVKLPTNRGVMTLEDFQKNGGKFGTNKANLFVTDKNLTLETVTQKLEEVKKKYTQNIRKKIQYPF
jgi:ATP-dependent protease ClpP protease subunit